jgi:hypothetical protein
MFSVFSVFFAVFLPKFKQNALQDFFRSRTSKEVRGVKVYAVSPHRVNIPASASWRGLQPRTVAQVEGGFVVEYRLEKTYIFTVITHRKGRTMIHNIPKPELSPNFTIDDIHKIREWNYERLKNATVDERLADMQRRSAPVIAELEERKRSKE